MLRGTLWERLRESVFSNHYYTASWRPVVTKRSTFHKVVSVGRTWVLSFRGPWSPTWQEFRPAETRFVTLAKRTARAIEDTMPKSKKRDVYRELKKHHKPVFVWLTRGEHRALKALAKARGTSITELVRAWLKRVLP